MQRVYIRFGLH